MASKFVIDDHTYYQKFKGEKKLTESKARKILDDWLLNCWPTPQKRACLWPTTLAPRLKGMVEGNLTIWIRNGIHSSNSDGTAHFTAYVGTNKNYKTLHFYVQVAKKRVDGLDWEINQITENANDL